MPSELLKSLVAKAHVCEVVLPDFQRDFVWKPPDVLKLLASLLNGYPIGGLLFMENSGLYAYRPLSGVPDKPPSTPLRPSPDPVLLVLDGQQRLTSCYRAFYGTLDPSPKHSGRFYVNYGAFVSNPEVSGSAVEELVQFLPTKIVKKDLQNTAQEVAAGLFPLDTVFGSPRGSDYSHWLSQYTFANAKGDATAFERLSSIQAAFIRTFVERITSYQVHFEEIKRDTSSDVICTVFETINTTGKRLTVFDLLVARCYPSGIRLRDLLDSALQSPTIHAFDDDGEKLCVLALPRIIALMSKGSCRRADMLELDPEVIDSHWKSAVQALERALKLLLERYGCRGLRFIPLVDMIPPLAVILASSKFKDSRKDLEKLDKWYWRSVFSQYFVSSTETKMARSAKEWISEKGWLDDDTQEPESVRDFVYHRGIFDGVNRIDSAVYRGVMSLLLSRELQDFGEAHGRLDKTPWHMIEDHHIYPRAFLAPYGIRGDRVNNIVNRTPLLEQTNIAIGNQAPHVYLTDPMSVGTAGLPDSVLQRHCIPASVVREAFTEQVYERFLQERAGLLVKLISKHVKAEPISEAAD